MKVTALAEAIVSSRHADGTVSLTDLEARLSRSGLSEFARAVAFLARRVHRPRPQRPVADKRPWF